MITQEDLKRRLHYNPETGVFTWRFAPEMGPSWNTRYAGRVAGSHTHDGYRKISFSGEQIYSTHAAWLYMTGRRPPKGLEIDHRDTNPRNDRWRNLRLATKGQNGQNKRVRHNNTSGIPGVAWDRSRGKWVAFCGVDGKQHRLGRFDNVEDAIAARAEAVAKLHGEFAPDHRGGTPTPGFPSNWLCHRVRDSSAANTA